MSSLLLKKCCCWLAAAVLTAGITGVCAGENNKQPTEEKVSRTEIVRKLNAFSEQLFNARLASPEGRDNNILLQPLPLVGNLLALYNAAAGESQQEILSLLTLTPDEAAFAEKILQDLCQQPMYKNRRRTVWWLDEGAEWNDEFRRELAAALATSSETVGFFRDPEKARSAINAWAAKFHRHAPAVFIPENSLRTATRILVTNLDAGMKADFPQAMTGKNFRAEFTAPDGPITCTMFSFPAVEAVMFSGESLDALELPLPDGVRLALYMPRTADGIDLCEKTWNAVRFTNWKQTLFLAVPVLRLTNAASWRDILQRIGMESVFGENSGLEKTLKPIDVSAADNAVPPAVPALDDIYQADIFTLDVRGLNQPPLPAAKADAAAPAPGDPAFVVNRPFVFTVRDSATGLLIAMGRVRSLPDEDPTAKKKKTETAADVRGYNPWTFGMTVEEVKAAAPECAPFRPNREGRWQTLKAPWRGINDKRAEFTFDGLERLQEIRLWLAEGVSREQALEQLFFAEAYLQRLTKSDYKLVESILAKIAKTEESVPAIASDEVPQTIRGMRARLSAIRHPQLHWQVFITFSVF